MKSITLHPLSVLVGCALAGLAVVSAGAQGARDKFPLPKEVHFVGEVPAEWWTYVELKTINGTPVQTFTVPSAHHLVLTGVIGNVAADGEVTPQLAAITYQSFFLHNGTRVAFAPGTLLTADSANSQAQLWGYLEPVN